MYQYNILKSIPIFSHLQTSELHQLSKISTIKKFKKRNILFYQGDVSDKLHIVLKGVIEVYKINTKGRSIILKEFLPFEFVAEVSNYNDMPFPATARSQGDSEVLCIDYGAFKEHFLHHPLLVPQILKSMASKIINLEKILSSHISMDATERVAHYIDENEAAFRHKKHHEIAEKLNITPVTFSRVLKKFKDEKILIFNEKEYRINKTLLKSHFS